MARWLTVLLLIAYPTLWCASLTPTQTSSIELWLNSEQNLHLEAGTDCRIALVVPAGQVVAGQVVTVGFEQSSGTVSVRWLPQGLSAEAAKAVTPRVNRSGKLSTIIFRTIALRLTAVQGNADSAGAFLVQNQSKRGADIRIVAGTPRIASSEDAATEESEEDTAKAVALWSDRNAANLAKSLELLQAAEKHWRSVSDRVELTRVLALEAYLLAFPMDRGATALARLAELSEDAAKIADASPVEAGNAFKTAGFVFAKQAKYDESLRQYNAALPLFEKTEDTYNRVVVLENRAKVERIQGHNAEALSDVEAAIPLARQNADVRGELALEVERGAIAVSSGQIGLAYDANLRAISLAGEAHDDFLEGVAWSDMGVVYTELHEFEEADRALHNAEEVWHRSPNAYGQIQSSEDRAEMWLAKGDLASARAAFAAGAQDAAKSSLDREQAYFLRGLAVSEMRLGKLTDANQHIHEALEKAERIQVTDLLSAIYASSGDVEAGQHHWSNAAEQWKHADSVALQRGDTLDHVIALGGLVRAAIQLGDLSGASEHCQEAMSALESIRTGIADTDLRLSFFSSRHALYDLCVQTELRRGDEGAAFDAAERGRARTLLDEAVASGVRAELPRSLLERIDQNEKLLAQERLRLSRSASRKPRRDSPQTVDALLRERDTLRSEVDQSEVDGSISTAVLPLSQAEVMHHLDHETALLSYWLGSQSSRVWMITRAGVISYVLPSEAVLRGQTKRYLAALLSPLSMPVGGSAAERSEAISEAQTMTLRAGKALSHILLPRRIPAQIHRLLIVKDGFLVTLPFAALPLASGAYLGENLELATEPSATFAFRPARKAGTESGLQAVVFADPAGADPTQVQFASNRNPQSGLEKVSLVTPLPFARQEASSIREALGDSNTTVFVGDTASRTRALGLDWRSYTVAHFATHAVYRDNHGELSGLMLASGSTSGESAKSTVLSYSDVLRMKAPLRLAVLSACNSGAGKFVAGEGMLGLDNAFLAGGASAVLGTLWPVDDEASSVFMRHFYQALANSRSPIESLKQAQQKMAASSLWNAPYYWGAFSLSGDWRSISK